MCFIPSLPQSPSVTHVLLLSAYTFIQCSSHAIFGAVPPCISFEPSQSRCLQRTEHKSIGRCRLLRIPNVHLPACCHNHISVSFAASMNLSDTHVSSVLSGQSLLHTACLTSDLFIPCEFYSRRPSVADRGSSILPPAFSLLKSCILFMLFLVFAR